MLSQEIFHRFLSRNFRRQLIIRRFVSRLPCPPGKPPLIPPAKTKRYTVVHPPWEDATVVQELLWKRHVYNDALATYRAMYKRMNEEQMRGATGQAAIQQREDEEFARGLRLNEEENRRIAQMRKDKLDQKVRQLEEDTLREIDELVQSEQKEIQEREAEVLAMTAQSKDFVTLENMEEKILQALENPIEYNYAIDLSGNIYQGDIYLKYLTETPLASTPVSETTAPLRKVGRIEEGTGRIIRTDHEAEVSKARN